MTTLIRWNPNRTFNLINEFDRFFEGAFPAARQELVSRNWGLPLDVVENENEYIVKASIPGINPDDLNITLENDILTIQGEVKSETEEEGVRYHLRERREGSFSRSITFPVSVNADAVNATYEHGVLTLSIPKAEEVKPRRIAVKPVLNS
jgi:HSP20 family protein